MKRRIEVNFGSFERILRTPVYRRGWWFAPAADVDVQAPVAWFKLADHIDASAELAMRSRPSSIDGAWLRRVLPVGLGLDPTLSSQMTFPFGVVACRVEERPEECLVEVVFPWLLNANGGVALGFSTAGPPREVRDGIINAFGQCLPWDSGIKLGR